VTCTVKSGAKSSRPEQNVVAVTLAGVLDHHGLQCGTVCSSRPGHLAGADLTWLTVPHSAGVSLEDLADIFIGWLFDQHRRPVNELLGADRHDCR
jgi:hypothetical protein